MKKAQAKEILTKAAAIITDNTFESPEFNRLALYAGAWHTGAEINGIWYGMIIDDRFTLLIEDNKNFRTYNTSNIENELIAEINS